MPLDSPSAGLVALGAMSHLLTQENANDLDLHYGRLVRLCRQSGVQSVELRRHGWPGRYVFDGVDKTGHPWVRKLGSGDRFNITTSTAYQWRIAGEPLVIDETDGVIGYERIYETINGISICRENLAKSHSGVCLAGRAGGESATRDSMRRVQFRSHGIEADLGELLTIMSWNSIGVSRTIFFNTRTHQFDRRGVPIQLVVCDGASSLLRVLDSENFDESDVVGIVHRADEHDSLLHLGSVLDSLRQWYEEIDCDFLHFPLPPYGVVLGLLQQRG